jgi:hypothetical protein
MDLNSLFDRYCGAWREENAQSEITCQLHDFRPGRDTETDDPADDAATTRFVLSMNLRRRHLNETQRV